MIENDDMLVLDGIPDECIIGTAQVWTPDGHQTVLVYSGDQIFDYFVDEGMDETDAAEYINFNIEGAYAGGGTPILMWKMTPESRDSILGRD